MIDALQISSASWNATIRVLLLLLSLYIYIHICCLFLFVCSSLTAADEPRRARLVINPTRCCKADILLMSVVTKDLPISPQQFSPTIFYIAMQVQQRSYLGLHLARQPTVELYLTHVLALAARCYGHHQNRRNHPALSRTNSRLISARLILIYE